MRGGNFYALRGKYKVLRLLAEGGMGRVFLAEQLGASEFSKTVAVKVIRKKWTDMPLFRELFIGEAQLVADLIHENILQVYHLDEFDGSLGIVMEYIHGCTLDDINEQLDSVNSYIPPDLATFIISRVARALAYAHSKLDRNGRPLGIVHRDVSPPNIMVSWAGVVKLSDFGIAKAKTIPATDDRKQVVGKVPFLAPEQVAMEGTSIVSDIYSLGLVWYELLSGRTAYPAETVEDLAELHQKGLPRRPSAYNPAIGSDAERILSRMMAHRPEDRFQTAEEVVQALEKHMYSEGYGPTNEKLRDYLDQLFPTVEKRRILPEVSEETVLPNRSTTLRNKGQTELD